MKRFPLLLCAAVLAALPVASQAAAQDEGLRVGLGVGLLMGGQQDDDRRRHHGDQPPPPAERRNDERHDNRDNRDERYNPPPPQAQRPPPGNGYGGGYGGGYDRRPVVVGGGGAEYRDDRIGRAMAIGRSQGRVINAWPQGGSLFLVRVNTPHGRVDMIIDVDTGRIISER